jgi:cytochrome P450/NADPH-cytochrome P450 reductase
MLILCARFALQEAKTVLSMFLHKFKFCYGKSNLQIYEKYIDNSVLDGPPVQYDPYQATTKPLNMFMTIHPRTDFPEPRENIVLEKKTDQRIDEGISMSTFSSYKATTVGSIELPKATFLFGTQTGTAQDYANQLATQAKRFGFKDITLCAMDHWEVITSGQYDKSKRNANELVVICTSTYNGQPPDSAENFNKFLDSQCQASKTDTLSGIKYAVFGLGNKNWRTYQDFPRKVDSIFDKLGADCFFAQGAGNADVDMDSDFNEWCTHFWTHTLYSFGIAASESKPVVPTASSSKLSQQSIVKVQFVQPSNKEAWEAGVHKRNGEAEAILYTNRELQSEGSPRSTRHVEIDISKLSPIGDKDRLYNAGDHLEVYPENDKATVDAIALNFGWILDSVFEIEQETLSDVSPRSLAKNIVGPCSIRNMLTYYADISSAPSRAVLACFATQLKLVAPETATTFEKVIMPDTTSEDQYPDFVKKHRTLLDLQRAYPQVNCLDLGQFLASVPVIQPRRYSIASSPLSHPTSAHLTVGIVDDVFNNKHYNGLASSFLKRGFEGLKIRANLKSSKSSFSMPADPSVPLIMISAGTGFSPFRGFLQEREAQLKQGENVGETVLFFGCRRNNEDFIYQDELQIYKEKKVLNRLYTAFSRNEEQSPFKYVQHQLLANAAEIWNMIHPSDPNVKPAAIYICGSGAMSHDVRRAFSSMVISYGMASSEEEAKNYIDQLIEEKRYLCDVWG